MKGFITNLKRVLIEIIALIAIISLLFINNSGDDLKNIINLFLLKSMLAIFGIILAHGSRKLLFPYVDLQDKEFKAGHYVAIGLYFLYPYLLAMGG